MKQKMELTGNKKPVAQYISENDGVSHTEIVSNTDVVNASVSHATDKLKEKGVIKDVSSPMDNGTEYVVNDDVRIVNEVEMSSLMTNYVWAQAAGILISIIYAALVPPLEHVGTVFLASIVAIAPVLFYSIYKSLDTRVYAVDNS